MVAETRAYFHALIDNDLDASHVVKADFAMLNEKLAVHYGVGGVSGSQVRRVKLPDDCFLGDVPLDLAGSHAGRVTHSDVGRHEQARRRAGCGGKSHSGRQPNRQASAIGRLFAHSY